MDRLRYRTALVKAKVSGRQVFDIRVKPSSQIATIGFQTNAIAVIDGRDAMRTGTLVDGLSHFGQAVGCRFVLNKLHLHFGSIDEQGVKSWN